MLQSIYAQPLPDGKNLDHHFVPESFGRLTSFRVQIGHTYIYRRETPRALYTIDWGGTSVVRTQYEIFGCRPIENLDQRYA